ncbi:MAG TPA: hypothetical protein VN962_06930 [Polyangia bacterium]|nr:hypothetical protein [Polyangia bacterium]
MARATALPGDAPRSESGAPPPYCNGFLDCSGTLVLVTFAGDPR